MRSQSVITFLFACLAFGQPPVQENLDRVLHFTHTGNAQDIQEIATSIRAISEIRQLSADTDQRTLTLRGTPTQIALAEWLFVELDRLSREDSATHEYHLAGAPDDMVRVFYLTAAKTIQDLQEVATLVRTIADIRWACTYNAPRAITLRGTASQIALAAWLFDKISSFEKIEKPASQDPATREYRLPGADPENVVRLFYLKNTETVHDFQTVAVMARTIADIRRVFTYNTPRIIAVRGTADRVELAEWLMGQVDKPANPEALVQYSQEPVAAHQYVMSGMTYPDNRENVVRVFYLPHSPTVEHFQAIAADVRTTTQIRRLFTYNTGRAIAARGTAAQIVLADQMIKERDQ